MARFVQAYFTSNGSWTAPAGVTEVLLIGCGGGGGGAGGASGGTQGGAGGGGAVQKNCYVSVTPNTSYSITIGGGGNGGAAASNGNDGSDTTFGSTLFTAKGAGKGFTSGLRGSNLAAVTTIAAQIEVAFGGAGGAASTNGGAGFSNWVGNGSYSGGTGGSAASTRGGGGGGGAGPQGAGGNGGGGNNGGTGTAGSNASANTGAGGGGGGTGSTTGGAGGNGGSGYLYVIWVDG